MWLSLSLCSRGRFSFRLNFIFILPQPFLPSLVRRQVSRKVNWREVGSLPRHLAFLKLCPFPIHPLESKLLELNKFQPPAEGEQSTRTRFRSHSPFPWLLHSTDFQPIIITARNHRFSRLFFSHFFAVLHKNRRHFMDFPAFPLLSASFKNQFLLHKLSGDEWKSFPSYSARLLTKSAFRLKLTNFPLLVAPNSSSKRCQCKKRVRPWPQSWFCYSGCTFRSLRMLSPCDGCERTLTPRGSSTLTLVFLLFRFYLTFFFFFFLLLIYGNFNCSRRPQHDIAVRGKKWKARVRSGEWATSRLSYFPLELQTFRPFLVLICFVNSRNHCWLSTFCWSPPPYPCALSLKCWPHQLNNFFLSRDMHKTQNATQLEALNATSFHNLR